MSVIKNLFYVLLVAITYTLVVKQTIKTINKDEYDYKEVATLITYEYICGVIGILIGKYVFGSKIMKNKIMKNGLIFGGIILIFFSLVLNWNIISDKTKLVSIVLLMIFIIYRTYNM